MNRSIKLLVLLLIVSFVGAITLIFIHKSNDVIKPVYLPPPGENGVDATNGQNTKTDSLQFSAENARGCANFFVYVGTEDGVYYLTTSSQGTPANQIKDLSIGPDSEVMVKLIRFDPNISEAGGEFPFCNDIAPIAEGDEFLAQSGEISIEVSREYMDTGSIRDEFFDPFNISITLTGLQFDVDGELVEIEELQLNNVRVGWLPG